MITIILNICPSLRQDYLILSSNLFDQFLEMFYENGFERLNQHVRPFNAGFMIDLSFLIFLISLPFYHFSIIRSICDHNDFDSRFIMPNIKRTHTHKKVTEQPIQYSWSTCFYFFLFSWFNSKSGLKVRRSTKVIKSHLLYP